jgi:HEAT repeat protein
VANLEKYAPDVQHSLLHVVAAIGPDAKAAVPSLIKVSTSQDFHCPYLAYRALGSMGPAAKPAVDTLIKGLQSNIASYRRNAAIALGRLGAQVAPEAAPALIKAIDDPLAPVRDEAILALSNYGALADPAVPRLRTILQDVDSTQRAEAAMTLWVLTKDVDFILPRITEHLQYGDLEWEAAQVLAIMGPAAAPAVPQLIEALARDESVQLAVLEALGNIGPNAAQALPAIRKLLDSDEPAVRVAAERAIRQIESPQKPQATF